MTTCPTCKRTYPDDQAFCLEDGTKLVRETSSQTAEPTLVSYQPPPTVQPQSYQPPPPVQPSWTPPPQQPPSYPPYPSAGTGSRRMSIATAALALGFFCLLLIIHLTYSVFRYRGAFGYPAIPRVMFSTYGMEFFFALAMVAITVVVAGIALGLSFKQPTVYGGRGRALAAILMSVLSTIVAISVFSITRLSYGSY